MRISDWSSDVCSSDLNEGRRRDRPAPRRAAAFARGLADPALVRRPADPPAPAARGALARACTDGALGALALSLALPQEARRNAKQPSFRAGRMHAAEIGRASCRERVCQYV